jgi:hypothetical protein
MGNSHEKFNALEVDEKQERIDELEKKLEKAHSALEFFFNETGLPEVLCRVAQLINGWNNDGAWGSWDQSVYDEVIKVQKYVDQLRPIAKLAGAK